MTTESSSPKIMHETCKEFAETRPTFPCKAKEPNEGVDKCELYKAWHDAHPDSEFI